MPIQLELTRWITVTANGVCNTADLLKSVFDLAYNGNRAPMPMYIHSPWLNDKKQLAAMRAFIEYALSKPDVYFVSMRQLIEWMKNPVPKSQVGAWLSECAKGGLVQGTSGTASAQSINAAPTPAPAARVPKPSTLASVVATPKPAPAPAPKVAAKKPAVIPVVTATPLAAPPITAPAVQSGANAPAGVLYFSAAAALFYAIIFA